MNLSFFVRQKFYDELEALVFDDEAQEFMDETVPDVEMQDEKIGNYLVAIREEFGSDQAGAAKRSNASATNGNASKAAKTDLSMNDIEQAVRDGRANSCTVQNLKDFIKSKGRTFPSKCTKPVLVTLAEEVVNANWSREISRNDNEVSKLKNILTVACLFHTE